MANVNADLGELLQAANGIKTAISSIETTKSSMSRKYQQLGSEWKDKKYKEYVSPENVQACIPRIPKGFRRCHGGYI